MIEKSRTSTESSSTTLGDALIVLKAARNFLRDTSKDPSSSHALDELIALLQPYRRLSLRDVESTLRIASRRKDFVLSEERLRHLATIRFDQLKDPKIRQAFSNEELAILAQRLLGIAKWNLIKSGRKKMEAAIENALENFQTLNTIAENASKSE
jgi:hypothetical protein